MRSNFAKPKSLGKPNGKKNWAQVVGEKTKRFTERYTRGNKKFLKRVQKEIDKIKSTTAPRPVLTGDAFAAGRSLLSTPEPFLTDYD